MMRFLRYGTAWLLLVCVASCGQSELSRSQAAAAIAARLAGQAGSTRVFRSRCVEKDFARYPLFVEDNLIARQHRALEEAGLATRVLQQPTAAQCGTSYLEHKEVVAIALTPAGTAEKWPEHDESGGGWDIVLARRELIEVTSIAPESADTMRVEFTSRMIPTVGGKALGQTSSTLQEYVTFQRYDGGWQLVSNRPRQVRPADGGRAR